MCEERLTQTFSVSATPSVTGSTSIPSTSKSIPPKPISKSIPTASTSKSLPSKPTSKSVPHTSSSKSARPISKSKPAPISTDSDTPPSLPFQLSTKEGNVKKRAKRASDEYKQDQMQSNQAYVLERKKILEQIDPEKDVYGKYLEIRNRVTYHVKIRGKVYLKQNLSLY